MSTLSFSHCATAAPTVLMGAVESLLFDSSVWMWTQCSPTAGISPWFDYSQSCGQSDKSQHLSHLFSSGMWLSASSYWHQQSLHFSFRILSVLHTLQHHTNPKISGMTVMRFPLLTEMGFHEHICLHNVLHNKHQLNYLQRLKEDSLTAWLCH